MAHAILSASASHRWLNCTPSARWEREFPDKQSPYATEGTAAHALAEKTLTSYLKSGKSDVLCDDKEMQEAVQYYVDLCVEKISEARNVSKDSKVFVEKRLDFSSIVPQGFGTGDLVILSDKFLEVIDLKYGKGVKVDALNNSQLRLYAYGMYSMFGWLYKAKEVRMTIIQPRIDNVSVEVITSDKLINWAESIKDKAQKAFKGVGDFNAGEHCRFCKARPKCRKYAEYALKNAQKDFNKELEDFEIAELILKATEIESWLKDLKDYALQKALGGYKYPGLKLVAGRSRRKINDTEKAAELLNQAGFTDIYKPKELLGLSALEKLCGKKRFAEIASSVIEKPQGLPTLVSVNDKRDELKIENDFDDNLLKK